MDIWSTTGVGWGGVGWGKLLAPLGGWSTVGHVYKMFLPAVRPENLPILKVNVAFSLQTTVQN